jgi:hypothetical protein
MRHVLYRFAAAAALGVIATSMSGCAHSATTAPSPGGQSTRPSASAPPAGGPSTSAQMVCGDEAAGEISGRLGVQLSQPLQPTWSDQLYSCRYVYPSGVLVLSVKELSDAAATTAYYTSVQHGATSPAALTDLGEAAFTMADGSVVVRKDFKVLSVEVGGLPEQFGHPLRPRAEVAKTAATIIMNCWTGN